MWQGCLMRAHHSPLQPLINTLRLRQNGRHFADDIFKCIFLNENVWIPIEISLKFVPKGPIDNIPAYVQIMAWRQTGDKPLFEPMMVRLPTYICVTRPPWVKLQRTRQSSALLCLCVGIHRWHWDGFSPQRVSNTGLVSIPWHHHPIRCHFHADPGRNAIINSNPSVLIPLIRWGLSP